MSARFLFRSLVLICLAGLLYVAVTMPPLFPRGEGGPSSDPAGMVDAGGDTAEGDTAGAGGNEAGGSGDRAVVPMPAPASGSAEDSRSVAQPVQAPDTMADPMEGTAENRESGGEDAGAARMMAEDAAPADVTPAAAPAPEAHRTADHRVAQGHIWIDPDRLRRLPTEGPAWEALSEAAAALVSPPNLSDQNDPTNVHILAKALVHARTGRELYRETVVHACMLAIGTEHEGRTLSLGKELLAYVVAADLVGLPPDKDERFRAWLRDVRDLELEGKTLRSTHEDRPNNWGTYAGATRAAIAAYLGDTADLARTAQVFRGWLGEREAYAGFRFKDRDWQADPDRPVGINPPGALRNGWPIGGVLPDDQRRGGGFSWPPPKENYVYTALQGAVAQAVVLHNAGYDVWSWGDRALWRAFRWLYREADYPAEGDDTWLPHVINYYYPSADLPAPIPAEPGKNMGWTDWTHGPEAQDLARGRR